MAPAATTTRDDFWLVAASLLLLHPAATDVITMAERMRTRFVMTESVPRVGAPRQREAAAALRNRLVRPSRPLRLNIFRTTTTMAPSTRHTAPMPARSTHGGSPFLGTTASSVISGIGARVNA